MGPSSWSTDGRRLAAHQTLPGASAGIFLYDFDTRQVRRLTEFGSDARWLSDNRRLLFVHQDKLYLVDSQSKRVRQVLSVSPNYLGNGPVSLSADDRVIIYSISIREADIWLAAPE